MAAAPNLILHHITDGERDAFDRDGFVAIPTPVVSEPGLAAAEQVLTAELERSLTDGSFHDLAAGTEVSPQIHEVVHVTRRSPSLLRSEAYRSLQDLARELLGVERVRLHFDHAIRKPAHNGAPTGWHQDLAFDPDTDGPMATIWLSFCDVDAASSCMRYVPGSHHLTLMDHRSSGRDGLSIDLEPDAEVTVCELPRGGVSIHGARTIHGSSPNDSDVDRLAWITKFVPEDRPEWRVRLSDALDRVRWALAPTAAWSRRAAGYVSPPR